MLLFGVSNGANAVLRKNNIEENIDHRSLKDQGIDLLPTIHLGKTSSELQKKGLSNPRVEINNKIRALNKEKIVVLQEYRGVAPTFPTKPTLRNKMDIKRGFCAR